MNFLIFTFAAIAEITGCFSFWAHFRLEKSAMWLIPGTASLILFAYLLTLVETNFAGRSYAAYGAIYICASLSWMWLIENNSPSKFDLIGAVFCIVGAAIIMFYAKN